jgi:hypothetical protein
MPGKMPCAAGSYSNVFIIEGPFKNNIHEMDFLPIQLSS